MPPKTSFGENIQKIGKYYSDGEHFYKYCPADEELGLKERYVQINPKEMPDHRDIDIPTFKCLAKQQRPSKFDTGLESFDYYYADKNNVYIEEGARYICPIESADPNNFIIHDHIDFYISQSGAQFYLNGIKCPFNPLEAEKLDEYYSRSGDQIYFFVHELVGTDIETFQRLHPERKTFTAKDKNHVYYRQNIVPEADAESFHFLPECVEESAPYYVHRDVLFYAKDKKYAFYIYTFHDDVKVLKTPDVENFRFYVDPVRRDHGFCTDGVYEYDAGVRKKI